MNETNHAEIEERDLYAVIKSALRISLVVSDKTEITIIQVDDNAYLDKPSESNIKIIRCFKFSEEELKLIQRQLFTLYRNKKSYGLMKKKIVHAVDPAELMHGQKQT